MLRTIVRVLALSGMGSVVSAGFAQEPGRATDAAQRIRLSQVGYVPEATKRAAVVDAEAAAGTFRVVDAEGDEVLNGELGPVLDWMHLAGQRVRIADFSALRAPGTYRLAVDGVGESYEFAVGDDPYAGVLPAAVKSYTYQRAGVPVEASWGGRWARAAGHPDDEVLFHATSGREAEGAVSSPGGWYDAGDYNKYIVNAGFSVGIMLQLLDQEPGVLPDGSIDFPEAGNGRNDLLDELKVELDWMLTMQDPADGGVHHKLTTLNFEGMVMPEAATNQRYILAKGTTATLDFAACLALGARVFAAAGEDDYAGRLLDAAVRAYGWALAHPAVVFANPDGVHTGEYGDDDFADEWAWATMELYLTTRNPEFLRPEFLEVLHVRFRAGENWAGYLSNLAAYSLLHAIEPDEVEIGTTLGYPAEWYAPAREAVIALADSIFTVAEGYAYHQPVADWHWGSTSDVLGAAMVTANAHRLTGEPRYLDATRQYVDWVFGYNATGYSFVTGHGERTPMFIHHRPSAADGVVAPVPGFLVGGPNTYQQDTSNNVTYAVAPGEAPMASYADREGSYASNEVCLNWNAPLVYVLGYLAEAD